MGDLRDLASHLDPCRASAHQHEGQPGGAAAGVGLDLHGLERSGCAATSNALSSVFTLRRVRAPFVVAK